MGLHSLPAILLPATSLVGLFHVLFTIMVVQIALLLMRDFIFQQKKINWQVNVRFNGLAMYSYRQNHLALWVGDMAYWDLISVS